MSNSTLFLLQGDYSKASALLEQLQQMASPTDSVVLMAESTLLYSHPAVQSYNCYLLKADTCILPELESASIQIIDYPDFTELLIQHTRCISLK
ncbi:hypothetical protein [Acinetobacter sp. MB5]|uniref:hypothetical protein n=1 Tax=Acinetobacter sp. MB5 TaxID=2069438 RepID=UPI000DD0333D|nr:hypothetical protein [Acinetobacter sp. MB5]